MYTFAFLSGFRSDRLICLNHIWYAVFMKKTVVVYKSMYGSSKKYALEFARRMHLEVADVKSIPSDADIVVFFGGLYAGVVNGLAECVKHLPRSAELVLVTVGLADPAVDENHDGIRKMTDKVITGELKNRTRIFHLRGGMDYSALSAKHKAMMWMLVKVLLKTKKERSEEDQSLIDTYGSCIDFVDFSALSPVEEFIRNF